MASIIVVMIVREKEKEKEEARNNGKKTAGSISSQMQRKKKLQFILRLKGMLLKTIQSHHDTLPVLFTIIVRHSRIAISCTAAHTEFAFPSTENVTSDFSAHLLLCICEQPHGIYLM